MGKGGRGGVRKRLRERERENVTSVVDDGLALASHSGGEYRRPTTVGICDGRDENNVRLHDAKLPHRRRDWKGIAVPKIHS